MKRFALTLLLILLTGCSPAQNNPTPVTKPPNPASIYKPVDPAVLTYDPDDLAAAAQVAHVSLRTGQQMPTHGRLLWGDRQEDRPKIAHILRLIRLAKPAESPIGTREGARAENETLLTVEYTDGRLVQARLVYQRMASGALQSVPGRMYIIGAGEMIAPELDEFYRGTAKVRRIDLLPPVSPLEIDPQPAHPGSTITVRGDGWFLVKRMAILLLDGQTKQKVLLGEAPVEGEAFVWQGALPPHLQPADQPHPGMGWRYSIILEGDGHEVNRRTIQVTAP